jgi:hypothetical protein
MPIRPVSSADRVNVQEVWTINELRKETGKDEIEGGEGFVKQDKKEENGL